MIVIRINAPFIPLCIPFTGDTGPPVYSKSLTPINRLDMPDWTTDS